MTGCSAYDTKVVFNLQRVEPLSVRAMSIGLAEPASVVQRGFQQCDTERMNLIQSIQIHPAIMLGD